MNNESAEKNGISSYTKLLTVLVASAACGGCFSASMLSGMTPEQTAALKAAQSGSDLGGDGGRGEGSSQGQSNQQ